MDVAEVPAKETFDEWLVKVVTALGLATGTSELHKWVARLYHQTRTPTDAAHMLCSKLGVKR